MQTRSHPSGWRYLAVAAIQLLLAALGALFCYASIQALWLIHTHQEISGGIGVADWIIVIAPLVGLVVAGVSVFCLYRLYQPWHVAEANP